MMRAGRGSGTTGPARVQFISEVGFPAAVLSEPAHLSVAAKKGTTLAAMAVSGPRAFQLEPFPLLRSVVRNGPESVKGAPLLGAAKRTLDGEDRSAMINEEGKAPCAGRHKGAPKKWLPPGRR